MQPAYAPFRHNVDGADHARAFRVTDAGTNNVSVAAGRFRIDQTVTNVALATAIGPLANGTHYVYIDNLGAITSNLGGPYPANSIPLARVVVAAGDITGITDDRCFFYEDTAAGGGGYGIIQDEGLALLVQTTFNLISAIGQAGDDSASSRTNLYINARHYGAIVDSNEATVIDSGTATAVGGQPPNTITDAGHAPWVVNELTAFRLVMTGGGQRGQSRRILSNIAQVVTYDAPIVGVGIGDTFEIIPDTGTFRRLHDALQSGATSIFYRTGVDAVAIDWEATEACQLLMGSGMNTATLAQQLRVSRDDIFISQMKFTAGLILGYVAGNWYRMQVHSCLFDSGATNPALGLAYAGGFVVVNLYDVLIFGCIFLNLTGLPVDTKGAALLGTFRRVGFLGCQFFSCTVAAKTMELSRAGNLGIAIVSCLFNGCNNTTYNIDTGTADNQIITANRFIAATGPATAVVQTGGFQCQITSNFVIMGTSTETCFSTTGSTQIIGNSITMVETAVAGGTNYAIIAFGFCNIAGNFIRGPGNYTGAAGHTVIALLGLGNVVSGNTIYYFAGGALTGNYYAIRVFAGQGQIITSNAFITQMAGNATNPTCIDMGGNACVVDGNLLTTTGGAPSVPQPGQELVIGTFIGWSLPLANVPGTARVGTNNIGIEPLIYIREFEEHFEGDALNARWNPGGLGGGIAFLAGRGSFIQLTSAAGGDETLDLGTLNITENAVFSNSSGPEFQVRVRIPTTSTIVVWIGFADAWVAGNNDPVNFEGIKLTAGQWQLYSVAGGVPTATSGGLPASGAGVIESFGFRRVSNQIEAYHNALRKALHATNIPSANMFFGYKVHGTAAARDLDIDLGKIRAGV